MKTYHAENLNQVAAMFRVNAANEISAAANGTEKEKAFAKARANVWFSAAMALEQTELKTRPHGAFETDLTV